MNLLSLFTTYTLTVQSSEAIDDYYLIHFSKPDNCTWEAGASARFILPNTQTLKHKARWLTIASLTKDERISVVTRIQDGASLYKQQLVQLIQNDQIEMKNIISYANLPNTSAPLICYAVDVGIAAIRPVIQQFAHTSRNMHVYYVNNGCPFYIEELQLLSKFNPNIHFIQSNDVKSLQENFVQTAHHLANQAYYILAGQPNALTPLLVKLKKSGIHSHQIKLQAFTGIK